MRLKLGIAAVSLSLAAAVLLTGCSGGGGGGGGSTGGGNIPSPAPGGSTEDPQPTDPDNPGGSGSGSETEDDSPIDFSVYPLSSQDTWMHANNFVYCLSVNSRGKITQLTAMHKSVVPATPSAQTVYLDHYPFDYRVSEYLWDGQNLRCKRKAQPKPVATSNWVHRSGYKFVCHRGWFYDLCDPAQVADDKGYWYSGWIPDALVQKVVEEDQHDPDKPLLVMDGFPKNAFTEDIGDNMSLVHIDSDYIFFDNAIYYLPQK